VHIIDFIKNNNGVKKRVKFVQNANKIHVKTCEEHERTLKMYEIAFKQHIKTL
jgi:hypothetical protein